MPGFTNKAKQINQPTYKRIRLPFKTNLFILPYLLAKFAKNEIRLDNRFQLFIKWSIDSSSDFAVSLPILYTLFIRFKLDDVLLIFKGSLGHIIKVVPSDLHLFIYSIWLLYIICLFFISWLTLGYLLIKVLNKGVNLVGFL